MLVMSALPAGPNPAGPPVPQPAHSSVAWLLKGLGNTPGVLALREGRLSFTSDDGVVFDEALTDRSTVRFPWWYFGGGFTIAAGGTRRRVSLTRPNDAPAPGRAAYDLAGLELLSAALSIGDAVEGRRSGRVWRALLCR